MPLGIMQFLPIYHPLHDTLHIHSEVCVLLFVGVLFLVTWAADRRPSSAARSASAKGINDQLCNRIIILLEHESSIAYIEKCNNYPSRPSCDLYNIQMKILEGRSSAISYRPMKAATLSKLHRQDLSSCDVNFYPIGLFDVERTADGA